MLKNMIMAFLAMCYLVSCNTRQETVEVKGDNGATKERYLVDKKTQLKEGLSEQFYPNGKKFEVANYVKGALHGKRTMYYENGQIQYEEAYNNGQLIGEYKGYHESGKLKLLATYLNGAIEGEWKSYYENGQLKEVVLFKNNAENGPFVEYYENGKLKAEGAYLNGDHEEGLLKLYDEAGNLTQKMDCKNGVCHTTWRSTTTRTAEM